MEKYVCIHGHFYQPPRENPWLEAIEIQGSAYPYHDWNERITAECYAPNSAARIIDGEAWILDIVSNYAKISFNFGPTLLSWMESHAPDVYRAIIEADKVSTERYSGHGSAMAQAYNHVIMPLANNRDKRTQIIWGIKDFEHRFKRLPEGMWLPETAVDIKTLDLLAQYGIKFTVLAPHQALRARRKGAAKWRDVSEGRIDPTRPYSCRLPSGRRIDVIFYDGPISKAVAFEDILNRGEDLVNRIMTGFSDRRHWPQVVSLATDGETYGHHKIFGDMALAYALHYLEEQHLARLTNFGEYLERYQAAYEVQIIENTSWSCFHGIERWRGHCGCSSGGHSGWSQKWRTPLREALDWLRDTLAPLFEGKARVFVKDPWVMRDDYIDVILDRSFQNVAGFLAKHSRKTLTDEEKITVLKLLEMQRHTLLMYTSCGWFFDELSGLETVQILSYAARAIQLGEEIFGVPFEHAFLERLQKAKSNLPEFVDGDGVYQKLVKTATLSLKDVGVHYAVSSLFQDYGADAEIYSYSVRQEDYTRIETGGAKMAVGRVAVLSDITHDAERISFAVTHLGNHFLSGGVRTFLGGEAYDEMRAELRTSFGGGDFSELARLMDKHFGMHTYSLVNLFRDQRRKVLALLTERTLEYFRQKHRKMYDESKSLMNLLVEAGVPIPEVLLSTAALILEADLVNAFQGEGIDVSAVEHVTEIARKFGVKVLSVELEFKVRRTLEALMKDLHEEPSSMVRLAVFEQAVELVQAIPLKVNLWQVQNLFFRLAREQYRELISVPASEKAAEWSNRFRHVGEMLCFNLQALLRGREEEMHE